MKIRNICKLLMVVLMLAVATSADAAGKKKKVTYSSIRIEVVTNGGAVLKDYTVSSSKNRIVYSPDKNGVVNQKFTLGDVLKIKASGYETRLVEITEFPADGEMAVTMTKTFVREDENHIIYTVDGGQMTDLRSVGAYSSVKGEDLESYPSSFLMDALSGRLNGLYYRKSSAEPASSSWNGFVRGANGGTPVIMVDGVVRNLDYVDPETIESVELLKDASLKALYGGINTNAILMVKTKRGRAYENSVRVNVQSGASLPTAIPDYLDSREYAELYNRALTNSGLAPIYNPADYDGSKPYQFPNVNVYDELLKKAMTITRANAQFSGGSRNTQYFLHVGFINEKGLEKLTDNPQSNRSLSVRGNVDNTILDFITLKVGINAALQIKKWPNTQAGDFFTQLSDFRPNEYPLQIPGYMVGSDKEWVLGGSPDRLINPLGAICNNGSVEREYSYIQTDVAMKFDFNKWIKGFSITPSLTFDIYNYYSSRKDGGYSVYQPVEWDADGNITGFRQWGYDNVVTSLKEGVTEGNRNWHFRTVANYDRTFNRKHKFSAAAMFFMQQSTFSGELHNVRRLNIAGHVNYMYDNRYVIDATVNGVGVPSFSKQKRIGAFPTLGAGWVISSEEFMKNADWLDYLKVRASWGILGSTLYTSRGIVENYYYKSLYSIGGSYGQFTSFNNIVDFRQTGNPDLGFQKSHETNIGVDFEVLDHSLYGSVTLFGNDLRGIIVNSGDVTPGVGGKGAMLMFENVKASRVRGAEFELAYNKKFGDFELLVGGNMTYSRSTMLKELDIPYTDELEGLRKLKASGDVKGYEIVGTFADQDDIANSPVQSFGGKVYPGDFKYKDVNGDGYINDEDRTIIANTSPKFQYGINIGLKYKGFNLDVLGYGLAGFDVMLTSKYYQIYGNRKYSEVVIKGLPNGNPHPTLYAENNRNNFVSSDYWKAKGGFFKIRNIEFGYTIPDRFLQKVKMNSLKIYFRGTNLASFSQIKGMDPECLEAGLTQYPLAMTFTGGLSFKF